jgi:NADP-dependent 3-hydroxy acid dehydrogenase YdfG
MDKWRDKVAVVAGSISSISKRILEDLVRSEVTVVLLAREAHKTTVNKDFKSDWKCSDINKYL